MSEELNSVKDHEEVDRPQSEEAESKQIDIDNGHVNEQEDEETVKDSESIVSSSKPEETRAPGVLEEVQIDSNQVSPAEDQQEDVTDSAQSSTHPNPLPKITTTIVDTSPSLPHNGRHSRAESIISTASISSRNSSHISFVKTFISTVTEHKDVKKLTSLIDSSKRTLQKLNDSGFDSLSVFETLKLATESKITEIVALALDCFSKIFTFQLFEPIEVTLPNVNNSGTNESQVSAKVNLIDAAIETIASAFDGEGTDAKIEVQVVRALMAGVLNEQIPAHGSTLLRAVRQIYNIFILSLSPPNQGIAQASLTQVVNVIFDRVEKTPQYLATSGRIVSTPARKSSSSLAVYGSDAEFATITPSKQQDEEEPLTLQNLKNLDDDEERIVDQDNDSGDETELIIKDAFLLFRAMCKLSVKNLDNDSLDMRSHAVRSKLISLHIIHSIIKEHIDIFTSESVTIRSASAKESIKLVDAIRQYLSLTIARNAASAISPVFETTLEIFWLIISNLRSQFKREIPVLLNEIYFPVAELKTSTAHQKRYFLFIVQRFSNDPRALIEFYLNYDCDSNQPNIVEKFIDYLTKLALTRVEITPNQKAQYKEHANKSFATYNLSQLPLLSISKLSSNQNDPTLPFPVDYALKITSLTCIVGILRSLNSWAQKGIDNNRSVSSSSLTRKRSSTNGSSNQALPSPISHTATASVDDIDVPQNFENLKQRKTALQDGIRRFNYKPKRGIEYLVSEGFVADKNPKTIARFLLDQVGLDKAVIGEYLGEGDDENIAIMHEFVDFMDFSKTSFVDAMRTFLQAFRLPGEAQKIDRFMLKFAERYLDGNPGVFANADTAYVLAYSVIMLNTDQHSSKVKNRMTVEDFIKNNRGIDDGKSLPDEYLIGVFNEISQNEIKLQSEQHSALLSGEIQPVPQQSFNPFSGRDVNREAYIQASKEISNKTEQLFKSLPRSGKDVYYYASHIEHVKSIFDTLWMSFLAALTTPFKEYDDEETIKTCLEGLRLSISIAALFELDYARTSFIGALVQFTNLSNVKELKNKNVDAVLLLLRIAESHGNQLKDSWREILTTISQVERLQLIAKGIEADVVPDVTNARLHRTSLDSQRSAPSTSFFGFGKRTTLAEQAQIAHHNQHLDPAIGQRITSTDLSVAIDKVFTQSSQLHGNATIDFIKALTDVASEEIESSLESTTPRTFSLQKVIDVCHYNMGRIRLEWSPIWVVIGSCFNKIGTKHNLTIVFFALDSLRQLAVRFLDIEELTGFKFQEEFLKPFDYILKHARDIQVTEMVIFCFKNLINLKGGKIKSGWKSIFSALRFTASDINEQTVWKTYELTNSVYKAHFETILNTEDAYVDLLSVLKEIAKNSKFQKISLHALDTIKAIVTKIAVDSLEEGSSLNSHKDIFNKLWYPALSSFNEVIMTADDLEVRSKALNLLFDILVKFGSRFDVKFWDDICVNLLFPIFGVLSKHWEINQFNSHDDLSVWLSTTLIQALRNMIALFTHYFEALSRMLDGYLGLLISCICQENDTIARIGRSCFQQLITQNMDKFTDEHWDKITDAFEKLFELTTAVELFESDPLREENIRDTPSIQNLNEENGVDFTLNGSTNGEGKVKSKAKSKNSIVVKCILQLLMIETLSELFESEDFYRLISYEHLTKLSSLLEKSFRFSRKFNDDYNLRVRLWNSGVIEKLPNLLKQESSSAAVYINVTFKVYRDAEKITQKQKEIISASLIPMCVSIVERYVQLDDSTQQRNISTWRPVVVEILQGYCELEQVDFNKNCPHVYDLVLDILDKSVPAELRTAIKAFFTRVGDVYINDDST